MRAVVEGPEGRKVQGRVYVVQLVDAFGADEVFQPVLAQVSEGNVVRRIVAQQLFRGLCEQHLPSMRRSQQSSHPVEQRAGISAIPHVGHARVEGQPNAECRILRVRCGLIPHSMDGSSGVCCCRRRLCSS
jgi:hypothetical protein